jgi:hypothetical protein
MMREAGCHPCRKSNKRGAIVYGNKLWLHTALKKLTRGVFGSADPITLNPFPFSEQVEASEAIF